MQTTTNNKAYDRSCLRAKYMMECTIYLYQIQHHTLYHALQIMYMACEIQYIQYLYYAKNQYKNDDINIIHDTELYNMVYVPSD